MVVILHWNHTATSCKTGKSQSRARRPAGGGRQETNGVMKHLRMEGIRGTPSVTSFGVGGEGGGRWVGGGEQWPVASGHPLHPNPKLHAAVATAGEASPGKPLRTSLPTRTGLARVGTLAAILAAEPQPLPASLVIQTGTPPEALKPSFYAHLP